MRAVLLACTVAIAFVASGCGDQSGCLPAIPGTAECGSGVFIVDASTTDPICLSNGDIVCRGSNSASCYVCTGAAFDDNCTVTAPQQTVECVHSCDKC